LPKSIIFDNVYNKEFQKTIPYFYSILYALLCQNYAKNAEEDRLREIQEAIQILQQNAGKMLIFRKKLLMVKNLLCAQDASVLFQK